ncbi:MAG: polysaccharide deacetylase family protein [Bacteroidales bacterium]
MIFLVKPPGWFRWFSPGLTWRIPGNERVLYLTFDDGPVPGLTEWILQELERFGARATFFCVGDNVRQNPGLYGKILEAGHVTGNHTDSHLNGYRTGTVRYVNDVYSARGVIQSKLFRPPYGRIRRSALRILRRDFRIILWDVLSMDYDRELESGMVLQNVTKHARPGSIIVFHDNLKAHKNLQYVLPRILDHFSSEGYRFLSLDENLIKK